MRPIANSLFARRSFRRAVIGAVTGIVAVGGYLYVRTNNDRAHVSAQLVIEAQAGNSDIVKDLMSRGADVNAKSADGTSAIALAAEKKHYDVVRDIELRSQGRASWQGMNSFEIRPIWKQLHSLGRNTFRCQPIEHLS